MKKQLLNYFLILLSVFILAYLWEFILEPSRPFNLITSDTESNYERWEYIFTATFFCFLALIIPTLILIKSEKAKKQAETELTAIFNSSALGITISDLQGKILRTNPAHQLIFGYSLDDLKSMVFSDFTHPDDKKRHQVVYEKMISGEISHFNMRKRFIHKEGHIVWANVTVSLIKNDDQKPMFILGMVEDISSHIQAENRLQESERRFRELSEMLPEALFETDLDMNLTYANR